MKVKDVKPGMNGINLVVRVVSVSKPRKVMTRCGEAVVASALVTDETGEITLTLWRSQVNVVKPGYMLRIEEAFTKKFRDKLELNVGRRGRIIVVK
mgnify:FL=1